MLLATPSYIFGISDFLIPIFFLGFTGILLSYLQVKYVIFNQINYILCSFITDLNNNYLHTQELAPLLYATFLTVLILNIVGILGFQPILASPLILIMLVSIIFITGLMMGIKKKGIVGFLKSLIPSGIPLFIAPLLLIIELISLLIKPIILCFRLLLSIAVGHVVLETFISITSSSRILKILLIPLLMIDIAKAFLYAFLFTMFSASMLGKCIEYH